MKAQRTIKRSLICILVFLTILLLSGCGTSANDPAASGLEYELSADGRYFTVVKFTDKTNTDVIIPRTYKGRAVRVIGDSAFSECTWIKSISIPSTVKEIKNFAFFGCTGLTELVLPNSVETLGESAFNGCTGIVTVKIPAKVSSIAESALWNCDAIESIEVKSSNKHYASLDGHLYTKDKTSLIKYAVAKKDTAFILPKSVSNICTFAFDNAVYLEEITIPNGVRDLIGVFYNCAALKTVRYEAAVISADIRYIECGALENIDVASMNPTYQSIDGNLYTKDGTMLIKYASAKSDTSFSIPKSVKMIANYAFEGASNLESIRIPKGVEAIGSYAFSRCTSLKELELPEDLMSIGESLFENCSSLTSMVIPNGISVIPVNMFLNCSSLEKVFIPINMSGIEPAFDGCTSLKTFEYAGTKDDWTTITMSKGFANESFEVTVSCLNGSMTIK